MIHGFAGSVEVLRQLQKAECFISFGCKMLDPKRKRERAAAKEVRLDRLLLETDSPYMPPGRDFQPAWMKVDDKGKARNEPAMIASILQTFAELRKTPPEVLAAAIEENGRQFLKACFPTE